MRAQGFTEEDLFKFRSLNNQTFEKLDNLVEGAPPEGSKEFRADDHYKPVPWYFLIEDATLQVTPSTVQTEKADFAFTFKLRRDLGFNKTCVILIDFKEYFDDLAQIREYELKRDLLQIDRKTFESNYYQVNLTDPFKPKIKDENGDFVVNMTGIFKNCYNLTYVRLRWCILLSDNKQVEIYDVINYTIFRDDSTDPI